MTSLCDLTWAGGRSEARLRRRRPGIDALPWAPIDLPDAVRREAQAVWSHAVFLEDVDPELPAIVVGDFNEGDDGSVVAYLRQRGLASALAGFDGDADTWRWTTSVGTLHRQLDHIEHDDRLVAVAGRVLPGGNSDHLAVVADFVVDVATQPAARLP